jgi:hypothetical protein
MWSYGCESENHSQGTAAESDGSPYLAMDE